MKLLIINPGATSTKIAAVSYTHLDVYKRQAVTFLYHWGVRCLRLVSTAGVPRSNSGQRSAMQA